MTANTVRLAPDSALWSQTLTAEEANWISIPELTEPLPVTVKTRHSQREAPAVAEPLSGGRFRVAWVIIMIFVAAQTALARTQLKRKILFIPISIGFLFSVVCIGMYFIAIV